MSWNKPITDPITKKAQNVHLNDFFKANTYVLFSEYQQKYLCRRLTIFSMPSGRKAEKTWFEYETLVLKRNEKKFIFNNNDAAFNALNYSAFLHLVRLCTSKSRLWLSKSLATANTSVAHTTNSICVFTYLVSKDDLDSDLDWKHKLWQLEGARGVVVTFLRQHRFVSRSDFCFECVCR